MDFPSSFCYIPSMQHQGKSAFVTGGSRGIGRGIALELAREGADVALTARKAEDCAETVAAIEAMGRRALAISMDVTSAASIEKGVEAAIAAFGRIDICVNNAGVTKDMLLIRMTEDEWDTVLDTNLKGAFLVTKAVARPMIKQRSGAIVNVASIVGQVGNAGQCNYSASKAGLIAFTKSAAKELAGRGVRVNAVAPGFIQSRMTDALSEEVRASMLDAIPMKRLGTPEDVAKAASFLAGDAAAYVTGQTLSVNGGMAMI